jgi:hypothetical protein
VVVGAIVLGVVGFVLTCAAGRSLKWLHRNRGLSDVTGTVVGRDRQFTGKSFWTYPIVQFTTRDGRLVRQTFRQAARPRAGRKVRIVYDPVALPDGRSRSTNRGLTLVSNAPMIYSVWLLLWLWMLTAAGLASLAGCIVIVAVVR